MTFVELMITVVVLSSGIVMIYKGLLTALDYQRQMTIRSYAMNLLEHKMARFQFAYQQEDEIPVLEDDEIENIVLNNRSMDFHYKMEYRPVESLPNILQVDMSLAWKDPTRAYQIKQSAYISRF